jgi:hypothetical protein
MNAEQQAFAQAYQRNVAIATKTEVAQYFQSEEDFNNTIMADYKWDSIVDAFGIWCEARRFESNKETA